MTGNDPTTRRRVLAGLSVGVAGAAGCISLSGGGGGDGGDSGSAEDPQDARVSTRPEGALELSFGTEFSENGIRGRPLGVTVQRSVHVRRGDGPDVDVVAPGGRQYVFVDVATGNSPGIDPPVADDFALDVGGQRHRGWIDAPDVDATPVPEAYPIPYTKEARSGGEERELYGGDGQNGWVGFDLPAPAESGGDLLLQPTEAGRPFAVWGLPESASERLGSPSPAFSVADATVPDSVAPGDPLTVSVTAENAGDGAGTFRAALAAGDATTLGGTRIGPGESGTWEGTLIAPDSAGTVEVAIRTVPEDLTREVTVG